MRAVDIELRPCDESRAELFGALDAVAFPDQSRTAADRTAAVLNDARCPLDRYFLASVGGAVVGGFRILPLEMRVGPRGKGWIQVGGVSRLGVYPHFRRQGLAGGVLRLLLRQAHDQGDLLSLLYPTSFGLYRRYGYAIASRHVLYSVPPSSFPDSTAREHIRPATPEDAAAINRCYEKQMFCDQGLIRRTGREWHRLLSGSNTARSDSSWVYVREDGVIEGFLSTQYHATSHYALHRLSVGEWFVTSGTAIQAFLGFFRAQSASVELVQLPAPVAARLESALVEPAWAGDPDVLPWRQPIGKICSSLVGRIIRLHEAIAARGFGEDGAINLLVEDWSLPENSGYYSLHTVDGKGELRAAEERSADVRLDISVLSALYCGSTSAEQARVFGQLEASKEAAAQLDRMLGSASFMIWDYF